MNETLSPGALPALAWLLWGANAVFDTAGQLLLKAAALDPAGGTQSERWRRILRRPALWLGLACFAAEFLFWVGFLSLVPLSAGVLLGSINIVVVVAVGRAWFGERLTPLRTAGMLLIAGGVALVGVGA